MKKYILTLSLLAIVLVGCHNDSFTISGTIDGGANKTVWLEEIAPDGPLFIDSIRLDSKGRFKYTYKMPYRSMYNLHVSADNYIVTLPDYGERLKIDGSWDNLSLTYTISGSPESQSLWELQQVSNEGAQMLRQLVDTSDFYAVQLARGLVDDATVVEKHKMTDSIYHAAFAEQQEYMCNFIDNNQGSLATLIALYKPFNNRPLIDARNPEALEWYDRVLEGLQQRYPDNPHTVRFQTTTERLRSSFSEE